MNDDYMYGMDDFGNAFRYSILQLSRAYGWTYIRFMDCGINDPY